MILRRCDVVVRLIVAQVLFVDSEQRGELATVLASQCEAAAHNCKVTCFASPTRLPLMEFRGPRVWASCLHAARQTSRASGDLPLSSGRIRWRRRVVAEANGTPSCLRRSDLLPIFLSWFRAGS